MHASDWMTTWWRLTLNLLSTRSWSFFARSPEKKWVHDNVIFRSVYNGQLRLCMSLLCAVSVATCYKKPVLALLEQHAASLLPSSTLWQGDNNLFQTCHNNWEQVVRTHPDTGLTTTLLQLVCRSVTICAFLRV